MSEGLIGQGVKDLWLAYMRAIGNTSEADEAYRHYADFVRYYGGVIEPPVH